MHIVKVIIQNFRNIKTLTCNIDSSVVLIESGMVHSTNEFNLGKTKFINAILWCFGRQVFGNFSLLENINQEALLCFRDTNDSLDMSVEVEFYDEQGLLHSVKRVQQYSYDNLNNDASNQEYSVKNMMFVDDCECRLKDFLDKIKDIKLPIFLDNDFCKYDEERLMAFIKEMFDKAEGIQIFMVSYDNINNVKTIHNVLQLLGRKHQTLTINTITPQ